MANNQPRQSFLKTNVGLDIEPAGVPFWKPDGRVRRITVLAARKPTPEEAAPRAIKNRDGTPTGDTVTTLAVFDIEAEGVPHRWDVTSRRAYQALDEAITNLPIDLTVQVKGSGKQTTYAVAVAPPPEKKKAADGETCGECSEPARVYINSKPFCREHEKAARFKADVAAAAAKEAAKEAAQAAPAV